MASSFMHCLSGGATHVATREGNSPRSSAARNPCQASLLKATTRRGFLALGSALPLLQRIKPSNAEGLPQEAPKVICDAECEKALENIPLVTEPSGLQYRDIVAGTGPSPPVGFQVAANYVAMLPSGQVFDSSLDKGTPYLFRVGAGLVVKGLDEGILTMKVGGKRRIYVPGELAFPKGLNAAAGRPRVLPKSPVVFDVSLEYIPGLSDTDFE